MCGTCSPTFATGMSTICSTVRCWTMLRDAILSVSAISQEEMPMAHRRFARPYAGLVPAAPSSASQQTCLVPMCVETQSQRLLCRTFLRHTNAVRSDTVFWCRHFSQDPTMLQHAWWRTAGSCTPHGVRHHHMPFSCFGCRPVSRVCPYWLYWAVKLGWAFKLWEKKRTEAFQISPGEAQVRDRGTSVNNGAEAQIGCLPCP